MTSGSINLLKWLTEVRETFCLLEYLFIIKGYNSGMAKWKSCIGQGMGEWTGNFHALFKLITVPESSPTQMLPESLPFGFFWRLHDRDRLIKSLAIGD